jgi:hypothetical protein
MKTIITAVAATLFAGGVSAASFYHGLDDGNSDLSSGGAVSFAYSGVQPGVGDSIDIYGGLGDGNADLFKTDRTGPSDTGEDPNIYGDLGGSSDLQF